MQPYQMLLKDLDCLPENPESLTISVNFVGGIDEANQPILEVTTTPLRFTLEARDLILTHLETLGPFEGIPLTIIIAGKKFDFYVDLQDSFVKGQTFVEVSVKKRKGKDSFMKRANATTFELLRAKGFIPDAWIKETPYVIISDEQEVTLLFIASTTFTILKTAIEQVRTTIDVISDVTVLAIPDPAPPTFVVKISAAVKYGFRVAFEIAYSIALIIALKALADQIVEMIYAKLRYMKYMKFKQLIQAGCDYQQITFQSSVLDEYFGLSFLPAPHERRQKNIWQYLRNTLTEAFNKGYPTDQDAIKTHGSAISFIEALLNVKGRVIGNTFYMEREIFFAQLASTAVASNFNLQDANEDQTLIDLSKTFKRKAIVYARDTMDINTFDNIKGGGYEVQTEPIISENPDLVNISGADIIRIPFSLATRKDSLTFVENVALKITQVIDTLAGSNFSSKIKNRIGIMVVSQQFFQNSKLMWIVEDRQPSNYLDFIGAKPLYEKNHKPYEVSNSMGEIKESMPIPYTGEMLVELFDNLSANYIPLESGPVAEFLTLEFTPWHYEAVVNYRLPSNLGFNTKTIEVYED